MIHIALVGNPNSGKTTLFNALTGSNQFVGNWPGVTVEKKEGWIKGHREEVRLVDLPGIYSLSPYSKEEVIARDFLTIERPDAVINIVDGTNLERNLYLTTQILELGVPVVVAVNLIDVMTKSGDKLDAKALSAALGTEVVPISALKGAGVQELAERAVVAAERKQPPKSAMRFPERLERTILEIEGTLATTEPLQRRFFAVRLFERDEKLRSMLTVENEAAIAACEKDLDDDAESLVTQARYAYISKIASKCLRKGGRGQLSISDKIDKVVTNRFLALPIFAVAMFLVYYVSVTTIGGIVTDWVNDGIFGEGWMLFGLEIPGIPVLLEGLLETMGCAQWLMRLILDGIVAGVGAVLGFVPQMLILFLFLAFLEACGYMARIAFIMDRVFRRFGLSGKSFIPMLIGSGCGVPGIMASRTIENERDRRMTIMTTTFIPCGAKLPIVALIAGALFDGAWWVSPSAYFIGVGAIVMSGIILKKTKGFTGDPAPFVMELPNYRLPTVGNVLRSMWERGWSFIKKAGTIILLSSIVIWFTSAFGFANGSFGMVEDLSDSVLATIGNAVAWLFNPLGWGDWKSAVAAISGLAAKENVVGTFGILYGFAEVAEDGLEIWSRLSAAYTPAAAYSFLAFNLLCAPCFAAIGAIRREMNSAKWTWRAIGYQTVFAYVISLIVYQMWTLFAGGGFGAFTVVALALLAALVWLLARKPADSKRRRGSGPL